jgi:serine/threonine protein kinase
VREYLDRLPRDGAAVEEAFAETLRFAAGEDPRAGRGTRITDLAATTGGRAPAPGAPPADPVVAPPGYEIRGVLGRGGMGVVYLALHGRLDRLCALKMIGAGRDADPEARGRFQAEAEAAARLQHPHVVQIFGVGEHQGRLYLDLEYVAGGSLADRLDGTPWPPAAAARLVEALAGAVAAAHAGGVVHRDLKPSNILLDAEGHPKSTDFGLARSIGAASDLTRTDAIVGTPCDMAPEQAMGRAREAGPPADVYALGAVFYELLTGRPPFKAATVLETLEQVRTAEPVRPSRLQPSLPRDLTLLGEPRPAVLVAAATTAPGPEMHHLGDALAAARADAVGPLRERFAAGRDGAARDVWRRCCSGSGPTRPTASRSSAGSPSGAAT